MKTKQEQIEQIEKVLKDSVADYKHLKKKGYCYCYAETLIDNGYGDVSEYKEEIQRLKDNEFTVVEFCNQIMRDTHRKTLIEIKQAQIDVLNKVKDIVFDYLDVKNIKDAEALSLLDSTLTYDVVTCGIDELIKEIQAQ